MSYQMKFTLAEVLAMIKNNIEYTGSLRKQALDWKISAAYLSDIVNGRRLPGNKVLKPLNLKLEQETLRTYVRSKP
jgi:hypothetical protein